jgi:hypothetical protein
MVLHYQIPPLPRHAAELLQGPTETPFEGGTFELSINVPEQYPLVPPTVRFRTKIFHPNVHFKVSALLGKHVHVASYSCCPMAATLSAAAWLGAVADLHVGVANSNTPTPS